MIPIKPIKLSARAWEILLVIDERTVDGPDGHFWVPGMLYGTSDYCNRLGRFVNINGSGDAKIIKSLAAKGLVKMRSVQRYACGITEDGRLQVERGLEQGAIPLELSD